MAAIDLTKLDQQIQGLKALAGDPPAFQSEFHSILGFYHRYAHRKQKGALPKSFMRHYDLPEKVLPHLQNQLKTLLPEQALKLSGQLWQDEYFEARDTAVSLLGQLPISLKESVFEQILSWISEPLDRAVIESLFTKGTRTIIEKAPNEWKDLVGRLLLSAHVQERKMGLFALAKLIPNSHSDDLPAYYSWVRPFLIDPNQSLDANLRPVISALVARSDQETAYLLREVLADSNDIQVGRRIRHYLELFEESNQRRLLDAIKNQLILPGGTS